jgi:hypothetical protein
MDQHFFINLIARNQYSNARLYIRAHTKSEFPTAPVNCSVKIDIAKTLFSILLDKLGLEREDMSSIYCD